MNKPLLVQSSNSLRDACPDGQNGLDVKRCFGGELFERPGPFVRINQRRAQVGLLEGKGLYRTIRSPSLAQFDNRAAANPPPNQLTQGPSTAL